MKHVKLYEQYLKEKIAYPEGVKSTGDKILDKFAKLINSPSSTVNIMSWAVQGRSIPFMTGPESFSVTGNSSEDFYVINTSKGKFKLIKKDIKKGEELYDEVESIVQTGKPKKSIIESKSVNEANLSKIAKNILDALDSTAQLHVNYIPKEALREIEDALKKHKSLIGKDAEKAAKQVRANLEDIGILSNTFSPLDVEIIIMNNLNESKDSDTFVGNPGEDKRLVDIRAFRGSVKDLTDYVNSKITQQN